MYHDLAALAAAYEDGTLDPDEDILIIDNDSVTLTNGQFESEPHTLLRQALDLLDIPWDAA